MPHRRTQAAATAQIERDHEKVPATLLDPQRVDLEAIVEQPTALVSFGVAPDQLFVTQEHVELARPRELLDRRQQLVLIARWVLDPSVRARHSMPLRNILSRNAADALTLSVRRS